ncbi:MAG TPA: carbohydrate ABC transporter permease [Candidatus Blautia gallistercoris]|uniref:Carbohydrate ABC transporter permease n=1 Tax=Candidatus Blautia gallistercoris TaxID=2838490 RepID=A0A9D1WIA7_9FIRM|nr:carbohydrate ABC transporter permease [Candidatus Blautia gallistercoris]
MRSKGRTEKWLSRCMLGILFLLAAVVLSPLVFLAAGSFMGQQELNEWLAPVLEESSTLYVKWKMLPRYPTLWSYVKLLLDSPSFFVMFWNSVKLTFGVLAGHLLVAVPAAWAFARYRFPGKKALFTLYIALMMMPFQVLMLSNYLVLDQLHLLDRLSGIILPGIFSTFPVFLMYRFFESVPETLLDAARLDGAGEVKIFVRLGLPLGSPGIISAMVLGFLEYWNLIEQPMAFLKEKSLWPVSLFLPNITLEEAGLAFATSVVALLPALLVFLAGQDYLEQGIMASATKE